MNDNREQRREWLEPTIEILQVAETAADPRVGDDGNVGFPDCTRS